MHLTDQELVRALDGELSARDATRADAHLAECWKCRARKQELENAIAGFVRLPQSSLPPAEGPRALLIAQMGQLATEPQLGARHWWLAAACFAMLFGGAWLAWLGWGHAPQVIVVAVPNPKLTPGATVLLSRGEVCSAAGPKNKAGPVALRKRVFEAYGISRAEPRAYEVDYLITPALGGADELRNLWPQSYSNTVWNAQVKDDLEDRLRALVCAGQVDLETAQRDLATNWIGAYRKYFHTDQPR